MQPTPKSIEKVIIATFLKAINKGGSP